MPVNRGLTVLIVYGLSLVGIGLSAGRMLSLKSSDLCGADFPVFYAGGKLLGSPQLYSSPAAQVIQSRETGCTTGSAIFIRLPYFAAFMWPWSQLPLWPAFTLWRLASLTAIGIFIWLWPGPREWTFLACASSLPIAYCLTNGQDICFVLFYIAAGQALLLREKPLAAGAVLSLCAAKFHLFLLAPFIFWPERKRVVYGLAIGVAALLAVSYSVQGAHWPTQFLSAALDSRIDPAPGMLFNIRGAVRGNFIGQVVVSVATLASAVYIICFGDLQYRLAVVLIVGIVLSRHLTYSDAALLIPVALILGVHPFARYSRFVAIYLVSPVASIMMATSPGTVELPRLALIALPFILVWELRQARASRIPPASLLRSYISADKAPSRPYREA